MEPSIEHETLPQRLRRIVSGYWDTALAILISVALTVASFVLQQWLLAVAFAAIASLSATGLRHQAQTDRHAMKSEEALQETREARKAVENAVVQVQSVLAASPLLKDRVVTGLSRVIPRWDHYPWPEEAIHADEVVIVGLRLGWIDAKEYVRRLEEVLRRNGHVVLPMGDPRAPAIWLRYREEPHGWDEGRDRGSGAWDIGLKQLCAFSFQLSEWRKEIVQRMPEARLSVRLLQNYPTMAFYKFDHHLYVYGYPYKERGFYGPVYLFEDPDSEAYRSFARSLSAILRDSLPIENEIADIIARDSAGYFDDRHFREAALAIINHPLDNKEQKTTTPTWRVDLDPPHLHPLA